MAISINGTSGISGVDGSAGTPALQGSDSNTGISFGTDTVNINTGGSTRATVDSSGRVLVGTPSDITGSTAYQLQVVRNGAANLVLASSDTAAHSAGTSLGQISFYSNAGSTYGLCARITAQTDGSCGAGDNPTRLLFSTTADGASSPTERMRISANGNIRLDPNANGITIYNFSTGAGTSAVKYNYNNGALTYDTSNRYVKDNIIDCPYGIAEIKQLQPRKYFRTDDRINEIGFIADEVSEVMPEFVSMGVKSIATKNPEDTEIVPLAVNYEKMTAVLTKALQEAIAKIETLEASNADLAARLTALEGGAA